MSFCPLAGSFGPTAEIFSPSIAISTGCFWPRTRAFRITTLISHTQLHRRPDLYGLALHSFEDVQTACAIDQVDQTPIVETHVIALHALGAVRDVRHERRN